MPPRRTAGSIKAGEPEALGRWRRSAFYANKIITTGEGGMVVTDDSVLADRVRSLRNLCFRRDQRFLHDELGYNFRMTNLQAAIGLAQVECIDDHLARKRRMASLYTERLAAVPGLQLPVERPGVTNVYWMYGVVLDDALDLDAAEFAARLRRGRRRYAAIFSRHARTAGPAAPGPVRR